MRGHVARPVAAPVLLLAARDGGELEGVGALSEAGEEPTLGWAPLCRRLERRVVAGAHETMLFPPHEVAAALGAALGP